MNENLIKVYSVVKYTDGSFALKDIESPSKVWLIGKKAITFQGKRYATGGRKLIRLKRMANKCLLEDWCIGFEFDPESFDYIMEKIENLSSEFENSPLYEVTKGGEGVFYLDNSANKTLSLYHSFTIGGDYYIDRRNDLGRWHKFISDEDLEELRGVIRTLEEAKEKGAKVKLGISPKNKCPKVKIIFPEVA